MMGTQTLFPTHSFRHIEAAGPCPYTAAESTYGTHFKLAGFLHFHKCRINSPDQLCVGEAFRKGKSDVERQNAFW